MPPTNYRRCVGLSLRINMQAKELALKQPAELKRLAAEWRAMIRDVRFKVATRQSTKVRELRTLKKNLARLEMTLHALQTKQPAA